MKFLRDFGVNGFYRLSVLANKGFSLEESMIIFKLENDLEYILNVRNQIIEMVLKNAINSKK